jgi:hypothetical protein
MPAVFIENLPYMLPTKIQFIWLRGFQRRRLKCEKLTMTDDGRQVMIKAHMAFGYYKSKWAKILTAATWQ